METTFPATRAILWGNIYTAAHTEQSRAHLPGTVTFLHASQVHLVLMTSTHTHRLLHNNQALANCYTLLKFLSPDMQLLLLPESQFHLWHVLLATDNRTIITYQDTLLVGKENSLYDQGSGPVLPLVGCNGHIFRYAFFGTIFNTPSFIFTRNYSQFIWVIFSPLIRRILCNLQALLPYVDT